MANGRNINRALQMDPGSAAKYSAVESVVDSLRGMFSENQESAQKYNIDLKTLNANIAQNEATALNAAGDDEVGFLKSQIELVANSNLGPQDLANLFTNLGNEMKTERGRLAARSYAAVYSSEGRNNKVMQESLQQIPAATTIDEMRKVQKELDNLYINPEAIFYKTQYKPQKDKLDTDIALYDVKETYKKILGKVFDDFPKLEETTQGRDSFYAAIDGASDVEEVEKKWNEALSLFKSIHEVGTDEYLQLYQWLNSPEYNKQISDLGEKLGLYDTSKYNPVVRRQFQGQLNVLLEMQRTLTKLTPIEKKALYPAGSPAPTVSLAGEPQLIANIQVEELYFNSKGQIIPSVSGKVGPNAEITATDAAHMNQYLDANPSIKKDLLEILKKQGHNFDEETKKKYPKIFNPSGG
jgi:hypothetical protein